MNNEILVTDYSSINHLSKKMQDSLNRQKSIVVFKLIGVGDAIKGASDESGNPIYRHYGGSIAGDGTLVDPWEIDPLDANKYAPVIKNIVLTEGRVQTMNRDGNMVFKDKFAYINFNDNGFCFVNPDEKVKLARLRYSNDCATNKWKNTSVKPIWEEVKLNQSTMIDLSNDIILKGKAIEIAKGLSYQDVKAYCDKLEIQVLSIPADTRYMLYAFIDKKPREFFNCGISESLALEVRVQDGVSFRFIDYNYDSKEWSFVGGSVICKVPIEKAETEYMQYLISFLLTKEGIKAKKELNTKFSDQDE